MGHYDDIRNELNKEEKKKLKNLLKKKIGEMDDDDVQFIAGIINDLDKYKMLIEFLNLKK